MSLVYIRAMEYIMRAANGFLSYHLFVFTLLIISSCGKNEPAQNKANNDTQASKDHDAASDTDATSDIGMPVCGNGVKENGEDCDDGNLENGDGCNDECKTEDSGNCPQGFDPSKECKDCLKGYYGPSCTPCPKVNYKVCSGHGYCLDGIQNDGSCVCSIGFTGTYCSTCAEGFDPDTYCESCLPGLAGDKCDINCRAIGNNGLNCSGNGRCNNDGLCDCEAPFSGYYCSECAPDYYGPTCKPCECSGRGNCSDGLGGDGCHCIPGWGGEHCERCADHFTGENCAECKPHFTGGDCGVCENYWTGENCDICPANAMGNNCDKCKSHFTGPECNECENHWSGTNCATCPPHFDQQNNCQGCLAGWAGDSCDHCAPGFFPMNGRCINCQRPNGNYSADDSYYCKFTDERDQTSYQVVSIGKQIWMADNLRYKGIDYFYAGGNSNMDYIYGLLYTWENAKNICPTGWSLPNDTDFYELKNYIDENKTSQSILRAMIYKTTYWTDYPELGGNDFGFGAQPAGHAYKYYDSTQGDYITKYEYFGKAAGFWTSESTGGNGYYLQVGPERVEITSGSINNAKSVRCILK